MSQEFSGRGTTKTAAQKPRKLTHFGYAKVVAKPFEPWKPLEPWKPDEKNIKFLAQQISNQAIFETIKLQNFTYFRATFFKPLNRLPGVPVGLDARPGVRPHQRPVRPEQTGTLRRCGPAHAPCSDPAAPLTKTERRRSQRGPSRSPKTGSPVPGRRLAA